jgi:hypothetical protein
MKTRIIIYLFFICLLSYYKGSCQIPFFSSTRAISLNEVVFELKSDILGEFYILPLIDSCKYENDSCNIYGSVTYLGNTKEGVYIYVCKKSKRKLWQIIGKQQLYELTRYIGITDKNGKFEVKLKNDKEWLIFRDYNLKQDQFLQFTLKK